MPRRDTVNERILRSTVRRAVYVQRYGIGLVHDSVGFLNEEVFPDLIGMLEARLERIRSRGFDSGVETTKRYANMVADAGALLSDGFGEVSSQLGRSLRDLAKVEGAWAVSSTQAALPGGLQVTLAGIDLRRVQIVASQPVQGRVQGEWWESLAVDTQKRIQAEIGKGLATGETVEQMVQRIRGTKANGYEDGVLQVSRRQAEAIVRTSVNHVSTQAREEAFAANSDVIQGVQWVSTLDSRTTEICQERDGKVYPIGEGPRPPAHWNCRSVTVAVTKGWREIGIRKRDVDDTTRASMDGQVPARMTYGEWLTEQPAKVQDDALGATKARMFRAGEVELSDLVHPRTGRPVTLAELEAAR